MDSCCHNSMMVPSPWLPSVSRFLHTMKCDHTYAVTSGGERVYTHLGWYPSITRDTHCANDLAPRTSAFALVFPKYTFYVPNPCILGTRPVLPCKNGSCCKLELVGTKSVFVLCYSRYLSVVGCSQVELSYQ